MWEWLLAVYEAALEPAIARKTVLPVTLAVLAALAKQADALPLVRSVERIFGSLP